MARQPFNPDLIRPRSDGQVAMPSGPMTVSQLTACVKEALASSLPPTVHVVGEISNFKRHSSGHLYFTLKDARSELSCVMWRSTASSLKFRPADGLEVIATGSVDVFDRAGRYQLYARRLEPRGVGTLELAFRQLREKLDREGLFDPQHKKPIPVHPGTIGIVTSPTGAAIADMIQTLSRRYPCARVLLYPVRVQGDGAAHEIAAAVEQLNENRESLGGVDVIIVGRGGGSLEDLWAFNEEAVARAIFASRIPVISAVGHEVDVTIADLAADVRAATPTAAAQLAVPARDDLLEELGVCAVRLWNAIHSQRRLLSARLEGVMHRRPFVEPLRLIRQREQLIDEWSNRIRRHHHEQFYSRRRHLAELESVVQRIAPHRLLTLRALGLRDITHRLRWNMLRRLNRDKHLLERISHRLDHASPEHALSRCEERLVRARSHLRSGWHHRIRFDREQLRRRRDRLVAMSYKSILNRGFSITRTKKHRQIVRSIRLVKDHQPVITQVADGEFESVVVNRNQLELFE